MWNSLDADFPHETEELLEHDGGTVDGPASTASSDRGVPVVDDAVSPPSDSCVCRSSCGVVIVVHSRGRGGGPLVPLLYLSARVQWRPPWHTARRLLLLLPAAAAVGGCWWLHLAAAAGGRGRRRPRVAMEAWLTGGRFLWPVWRRRRPEPDGRLGHQARICARKRRRRYRHGKAICRS